MHAIRMPSAMNRIARHFVRGFRHTPLSAALAGFDLDQTTAFSIRLHPAR
jgi:hypothetical protein